MVKDLNRHFSKKCTNKNKKRCPILVIKEMQRGKKKKKTRKDVQY